MSGVHYPADKGRELHAVYHLQSMTHNRRIRLEVSAAPTPTRTSRRWSPTYPTADWHERETYDMFGIIFDGHPALTRILMPDDWPGHPQRKDYPLGGIPVEYKGATIPPPDQRRSYSMSGLAARSALMSSAKSRSFVPFVDDTALSGTTGRVITKRSCTPERLHS